jgi:hypothetical protein
VHCDHGKVNILKVGKQILQFSLPMMSPKSELLFAFLYWVVIYLNFFYNMVVKESHTRFEVFTAVNIQVEVFWVVMLHSVVVRYQWYPTATLH